jgi:predicted RNA-binding Zn-ribbon protein involved in translation (DUF1610 family)
MVDTLEFLLRGHLKNQMQAKAIGVKHMNPESSELEETNDEIRWVKFWETSGSLPAEVIAGRLKSEGVPAWVWQQGAGSALGLTYGPMGRGHVMVPEDQVDEARRIMATDMGADLEEQAEPLETLEGEVEEDNGWFSKGILALTALAVSPLGVAVAYAVAKLFGGKEQYEPSCPECGIMVDLDQTEEKQGWFVCPECGNTVLIEKES